MIHNSDDNQVNVFTKFYDFRAKPKNIYICSPTLTPTWLWYRQVFIHETFIVFAENKIN